MRLKVNYHTKNIDKTLYNQIVYKYVAENIDGSSNKLKDWVINIYPVESFKTVFPNGDDFHANVNGFLSATMPHGITGWKEVNVFIKDSNGYGLTVLQNASVVTHELAHMILMIRFKDNPHYYYRAPLRHDDKSGNVAGMELNKWTQEVHDRELEGNLKNLTVYRRIKLKWIPFTVRVLNLEGFPY
tara:strand:+ start:1746 stop:2303 length:558 start_codon:yes stop_codon:yes gene_type:complete